MTQKAIELILMRHLAGYLSVPIFVVDPEGTLLFYNEPAEALLGVQFDEAGEMPMAEWSTVFKPTDEAGRPIPPERLPLVTTLRERHPSRSLVWITGLDGVRRRLDVLTFPLVGQGRRMLGAVAVLWDVNAR